MDTLKYDIKCYGFAKIAIFRFDIKRNSLKTDIINKKLPVKIFKASQYIMPIFFIYLFMKRNFVYNTYEYVLLKKVHLDYM